jgi:hypothetical protein
VDFRREPLPLAKRAAQVGMLTTWRSTHPISGFRVEAQVAAGQTSLRICAKAQPAVRTGQYQTSPKVATRSRGELPIVVILALLEERDHINRRSMR